MDAYPRSWTDLLAKLQVQSPQPQRRLLSSCGANTIMFDSSEKPVRLLGDLCFDETHPAVSIYIYGWPLRARGGFCYSAPSLSQPSCAIYAGSYSRHGEGCQ